MTTSIPTFQPGNLRALLCPTRNSPSWGRCQTLSPQSFCCWGGGAEHCDKAVLFVQVEGHLRIHALFFCSFLFVFFFTGFAPALSIWWGTQRHWRNVP